MGNEVYTVLCQGFAHFDTISSLSVWRIFPMKRRNVRVCRPGGQYHSLKLPIMKFHKLLWISYQLDGPIITCPPDRVRRWARSIGPHTHEVKG